MLAIGIRIRVRKTNGGDERVRILFIANFFPRHAETFIREQVNSLIEHGNDVQVLVLVSGEPDAFDERSRRNGVHDRVIDGTGFGRPVLSRLGATVRGTTRAIFGYPRLLDMMRHGRRALRGQLAAILSNVGPLGRFDVIYAAFGPAGITAEALRDGGLFDGPIVSNFLGYDVTREVKLNGSKQYQRLFDHAALLLPNSEYLRERMLSIGAPSDRTRVHRLGVDTKEFSYVDRAGRSGPPKVLGIGRMVEKKGFEDLLHALGDLKEANIPFSASILGDGPLRKRLEQMRLERDLEEDVSLPGWCSQDEVARSLAAADIGVFPSVIAEDGDEEGLPLTAVEASARGLANIGTAHSGIPELIIEGETGFIVPERDPSTLAATLERLLEDPELRLNIGRRARAWVEESFDAQTQGTRLQEVLEGVSRAFQE